MRTLEGQVAIVTEGATGVGRIVMSPTILRDQSPDIEVARAVRGSGDGDSGRKP